MDEEFKINLKGSKSELDIKNSVLNELVVAFQLQKWFDFSSSDYMDKKHRFLEIKNFKTNNGIMF